MIGGNITGILEKRIRDKNEIGESVLTWETKYTLVGFLDLTTGSSNYLSYNTKLQESTHIFIADYVKIDLKAEESRMIINNKTYDVLLIDNPMELNDHLEIYLKYIGG